MGWLRKLFRKRSEGNLSNSPQLPNIHDAVAKGDLAFVQAILKASRNAVHSSDDRGWLPLHVALNGKFSDIAQVLVEGGADVNRDCGASFMFLKPLHIAAAGGDVTLVRLLISKGADVNCTDIDYCTPLLMAVDKGHIQVAEVLVASGAETGAKDITGRTPLSIARDRHYERMIEALTKITPKDTTIINSRKESLDANNDTPEKIQCTNCGALILLSTFNKYGGLCAQCVKDPDLNKLLIAAVGGRRYSAVQELVRRGAEINGKDISGSPILFFARSSPEMTKLLLELGADPNVRDDFGEPALIATAKVNQAETVKTLLAGGADVNIRDKKGNTALIIAVDSGEGWADIVKVLMERGAASTQTGPHGENALDIARRCGFKRLITLLSTPDESTRSLGKKGVYCILCQSRFSIDECIDPQIRENKFIFFTCPKCKVPRLYNAIDDQGL